MPSNKIEWIVDFMREREDTDAKVVIASNFTEVIELTADVLRKEGWEVLTLTGATSDKNRRLLQSRFQNTDDGLRVVILNTKAGGESITLDAADEMIVMDDPWKSDTSKQLHDRIHRVSRIHQVTVYWLLSTGTIEEWMASLTDEQRRILETASPRKLSELVMEAVR
jgi:SNF2 family DNA or RNA helicase